jgi:hypothetical protein
MVAAAVLFAILFIAATVLLVLGFMSFYRAESALSVSKGQLEYLYSRNPFPSEQNLAIENKNLGALRHELNQLAAAMSRGQVEAVEQSPAKFVTQFWEVRKALLAKAHEAGVKVADTFDFGFGRHMTGTLPAAKDVARLTQQLRIVETLCAVLTGARITELRGIGREEFEAEAVAGGAARPAEEGRGRGRRAEPAAPTALNGVNPETGTISEGQLFGRWHFVLNFTGRENAVIQVLDALSRNPLFIVVTRVELTGDGNVIVQGNEMAAKARDAAVETEGEAPVAKATLSELSRDLRIVCGRDTPVSVRLEVDVYQFAKQAEAAEAAPAAEGAQ